VSFVRFKAAQVTEEEIKAIIKEGTEGEVQEIEQDIVERFSYWRP
jgi:hypothetical protein